MRGLLPPRRASVGAAVVVTVGLWATACSSGAPESEVLSETVEETTTTTTVSSTTTTTTVPPTTTLDVAECLALAPLFGLVGQLVMATATEETVADLTGELTRGQIGGVVIVEDASGAIAEALVPLAEISPRPIVAVDEEGGTVQRLGAILGELPSARELAESGDPSVTRAAGAARGTGAAQLGFTMVLAPVLDVGSSAGAASRSFGDDVETVIAHGSAYMDGLSMGGVDTVAKHFPGHGSADGDSHRLLPTTAGLADLRDLDLVPFEETMTRVSAIMIGHLDVPDLTGGMPATLSAEAVALLRGDLGFGGVVVTDDLTMGALSEWTVAEAAELAIAAGNDLVIAGDRVEAVAAADRLAAAVAAGRLERARVEEAVERVLGLKQTAPCDVWPGTG